MNIAKNRNLSKRNILPKSIPKQPPKLIQPLKQTPKPIIYIPTPLPKAPITSDCFKNGEIEYYKTILPQLKTVFIIGAKNDEIYVQMASKDVEFHLFDPNPQYCQDLHENLKNYPNVKINEIGLSDKDSIVTYYPETISCLPRSHYESRYKLPQYTVNLTTLDKYCQENNITHIDFLKIDTEGFEVPIIRGSKNMLPHIENIQFEYGGTWKDAGYSLVNFFQEFSEYQFYKIFPQQIIHVKVPNEDFTYSNYIMKH